MGLMGQIGGNGRDAIKLFLTPVGDWVYDEGGNIKCLGGGRGKQDRVAYSRRTNIIEHEEMVVRLGSGKDQAWLCRP